MSKMSELDALVSERKTALSNVECPLHNSKLKKIGRGNDRGKRYDILVCDCCDVKARYYDGAALPVLEMNFTHLIDAEYLAKASVKSGDKSK